MSAHSPGPWHPNVNAAGDLEINDADGRTVVKWYASEDCLSPGDARLIAAAPELLAALKLEHEPPCELYPGRPCPTCALIARIEGK